MINLLLLFVHIRYRRKVGGELSQKSEMEKELSALKERERLLLENHAKADREHAEQLNRQKAESQRMMELQKETISEQIRSMESRFKSLSEEITKQRADELSKNNSASMDSIIKPLKETIEKMEKSLKETNEKGAEYVGSLKEQISGLMSHTSEIGSKADHLSEALRMKSKIQGNWGEVILETLLQKEGLERGIHYEAQKTLKDEDNNTLYPDFVLRLPDNRVVIIDSKVSLNDYVDFHSSEDEEEKKKYLAAHIASIRRHMNDLSDKQYFKHLGEDLASPDFVIMFVPIPDALILALQNDPKLYQDAMKKGVFLTNNQSLMPIIWVIKDLWTQAKQEKNMQEIVTHAQNLLVRLNNFFDEFNRIEKSLDQAKSAFESADKKIRGNQGVLTSARKIQDAGIKLNTKGKLPDPIDLSESAPTEIPEGNTPNRSALPLPS